jgi:hypothetical protein
MPTTETSTIDAVNALAEFRRRMETDPKLVQATEDYLDERDDSARDPIEPEWGF